AATGISLSATLAPYRRAGSRGHAGRVPDDGTRGSVIPSPPQASSLSSSRSSLPGLKYGIRFGGTSTLSPVFGLRPVRAPRWRMRKLPNPRSSIFSPDLSDRTMLSKTSLTMISACFLVSCVVRATSSTSSALVIPSRANTVDPQFPEKIARDENGGPFRTADQDYRKIRRSELRKFPRRLPGRRSLPRHPPRRLRLPHLHPHRHRRRACPPAPRSA